jgi:small multidrug resistance pump
MSPKQIHKNPLWMKYILQAAGIYNILWGAWILALPFAFFDLCTLPRPNYPEIWQSVGMIVGVYGLGYYIAAYNPYRHWPIILVGFLGKLFGPIGAAHYALQGKMQWKFLYVNLTNDVIWLIPFGIILYKAYKENK